MRSWIRSGRFSVAGDPVEQFHRDVIACTRELNRKLPALGKRYSVQAVTVSLVTHLKAAVALGVREGHITEEQVRLMMRTLVQGDGDGGPAGRSAAEPVRSGRLRE